MEGLDRNRKATINDGGIAVLETFLVQIVTSSSMRESLSAGTREFTFTACHISLGLLKFATERLYVKVIARRVRGK